MISSFLKILFVAVISVLAGIIELIFLPFHKTGHFYHAVGRIHSRLVLAACGVRLEVIGREKIDFTRSYIYVANHASHFDISVVIAAIPDQIRFVYKKELEKIPFFGWGLKFGKVYIGIDRGSGPSSIIVPPQHGHRSKETPAVSRGCWTGGDGSITGTAANSLRHSASFATRWPLARKP